MKKSKLNIYCLIILMSIMQSCALTYKPEYYIPHYGAKGLYRPFATDFSGYLCAYDRYPELINASSIDSMEIAYEKYKTNAVNYSIENGVQQNILLSQILIDYERCEFLKKSLPYAGKRFHEIKLNEHPFFVNKQFEMPYLIIILPVFRQLLILNKLLSQKYKIYSLHQATF